MLAPVSARSLHRGLYAACCLAEGLVFAWAAAVLPWRSGTIFAAAAAALAAACTAPAVTGAWPRAFGRAVAAKALLGASAFVACTAAVFHAATYLSYLYGGLGRGIAAGLVAALGVLALVTVPTAVWGLVAFAPRPSRRTVAGAALAGGALAAGLFGSARAAAAPTPVVADPTPVLDALSAVPRRPAPAGAPSLFTRAPFECPHPPGPAHPTALVTHLAPRAGGRAGVAATCLQADSAAGLAAALADHLAAAPAGPVRLDVVTATDPLDPMLPLVDGLSLRPGFDGVCEGARCLAPWQLVATEQLVAVRPFPFIPELRFGFDPAALRAALAGRVEPRPGTPRTVAGLTRIVTAAAVALEDGRVTPLVRGRPPSPPLSAASVARAVRAAESYILAAQQPSGRFRYILDPHTGAVRYRGFATARQAGTTLALCEVGARAPDVDAAVARSLGFLASLERRVGEVGGLVYPANAPARVIHLGPTALSLAAFLACRDRIGPVHDEPIARMGRFLLRMMRPDGGFHPKMDATSGVPIPGPDPLYAGGQAVLALVGLERLARAAPHGPFPDAEVLSEAVDRAMAYFAEAYWPPFLRTFFFLEENWHCLAARAALSSHRNDAYERFCLDYVTFKRRLVLGPSDAVDPTLWGGYGFGNVVVPHNTGAAGFGEAVSAALAVARARGETRPDLEDGLRRVLSFLVARQWDAAACTICTRSVPVVGAFSEHLASPHVRIDYVQHAMAALGHGGAMLFGRKAGP